FRAPFDSFHLDVAPPFVEQLLSDESLARTGYFDVEQVAFWRKHFRTIRLNRGKRVSVEMGLVGVLATQLWHHTYIEGSLCELPGHALPRPEDGVVRQEARHAASRPASAHVA